MTTSSTIDGTHRDGNDPAAAAPANSSPEAPPSEEAAPPADSSPEAPPAEVAAPALAAEAAPADPSSTPPAVESAAPPPEGAGATPEEPAAAPPETSASDEGTQKPVAEEGASAAAAGSPAPGRSRGRRAPRPGRPHARPAKQAVEAVEVPPSDPTPWGRVDEEGRVWVRTGETERQVGSYPEVSAEEALALFGRKFDELVGQVRLLRRRVEVADLPPKDATSTVEKLRDHLTDAPVVGDLQGLTGELDEIAQLVEQRRVESEQARAKAREEARATKERLVEEAEKLADSTSWKASGDRLRGLLEEWKAAPRLDRKSDDELWKRFSSARSAFDKKRRAHFAALDSEREEAKAVKTRIVKEAEALASSREWGPTAGRYRTLLEQWKASGRAAKPDEDALWQRFRAAQDTFFGARNATFEQRDASERENLAAKEALATEAERLLPVRDLRATKSALRSLQERWESIGHVPRADKERIEGRMRRVEQAVRDAEQQQWQRTNPEARARAESATGQLRASIEKLEAQAAAARAAGNDKKADEAEAAAAAKREWLAQAEKYVT